MIADALTFAPVDVVLRDGETVRVRPLHPEDEPELVAFLDGLSTEARAFRFFSGGLSMRRAAHFATAQLDDGGFGLVAVAGEPSVVVAHAMFSRPLYGAAEVAVAVADDWQGRGLATLLLAHLAAEARSRGIETFTAMVLPDNHKMIEVLRESGYPVQVTTGPGELVVTFPAATDGEARRRFERRERDAAIAAARHLLAPRSIALVGATARAGSVGAALLTNLRASRLPIHLVGRRAGEIDGLPVHASIADIPGPVDLAVIALPARHVVDAARACGRAGVRTLLVIASGFEDAEGARRRAELVEVCRDFGMRLVGPNTIGVLSTAAGGAFNATFARTAPHRDGVGLLTQSGGLLISALEQGRAHGIGLSAAVSIGDRADISSNDLLQWWEQDPATRVVALYVESFGNPRSFARIARRVARTKPIVAVKAGRSAAGVQAAASHTGSLVAESDRTTDALFRHAGVIRTDTFRELLDVAALLSSQPLPEGRRVGIVTNAGGPAILCADACDAAGLRIAEPAPATRSALAGLLPTAAAVGNPVDMLGDATPDRFADVVRRVADDPAVDALIVICAPTFAAPPDAVVAAVDAAAAAARRIPVLAVVLAERPASAAAAEIPVVAFPEDAVRALGRVADYAAWRRSPHEPAPCPGGIDADAAAAVLAGVLAAGREWLSGEELERLAAAYGLPRAPARIVARPDDAVAAAAALGGPVAVKGLSPTLVHKTDAGAVRLGLATPAEVRAGARDVCTALRRAGHPVDGLLVQRMAPPGTELLIGVTHDPAFGAVVACAAGGVMAELLDDVAVRLAPLERGDAEDMLRSLGLFPLLRGYRGAPGADLDAVTDVLQRLAAMAAAHPEIREVDANPVLAGPEGAVIVDLRVRIAPAVPRPWAPSVQEDRC